MLAMVDFGRIWDDEEDRLREEAEARERQEQEELRALQSWRDEVAPGLIRSFIAEMLKRGVEPEPQTVFIRRGTRSLEYETNVVGWKVHSPGGWTSWAVGRDGQFYSLTVPNGTTPPWKDKHRDPRRRPRLAVEPTAVPRGGYHHSDHYDVPSTFYPLENLLAQAVREAASRAEKRSPH